MMRQRGNSCRQGADRFRNFPPQKAKTRNNKSREAEPQRPDCLRHARNQRRLTVKRDDKGRH